MNYPLEFEEFVDELIVEFVNGKFTSGTVSEISRGFTLLEAFDRKFYQDPFIDLITDESIDSLSQQDLFIVKLIEMLKEITEAHGIDVIDSISINEINEIIMGILNISLIEDKSLINSHVNSMDSDYNIGVKVISSLCYLEDFEMMILIKNIQPEFIENVKGLCADSDPATEVDSKHEFFVKVLSSLVKENQAVGLNMIKAGVPLSNHLIDNLQLLSLGQFDLMGQSDFPSYMDAFYESHAPQCALDVLSLLMISKDTYQMCLMHLEKQADLLFKKEITLERLKPVAAAIFQDLVAYKETVEKANEGQTP